MLTVIADSATGTYATTASGYVITVLLTIVTLGGGALFRGLSNDMRNLAITIKELSEKENTTSSDVKVLVSEQKNMTEDIQELKKK